MGEKNCNMSWKSLFIWFVEGKVQIIIQDVAKLCLSALIHNENLLGDIQRENCFEILALNFTVCSFFSSEWVVVQCVHLCWAVTKTCSAWAMGWCLSPLYMCPCGAVAVLMWHQPVFSVIPLKTNVFLPTQHDTFISFKYCSAVFLLHIVEKKN